jgi:sugar phosphate isomerase/epimerase
LCVFSKHLADARIAELGRVAKDLGFEGVDLTVRPKGHVLPERVAEDLPRAQDAIRGAGLALPMITTELIDPKDPFARPTLSAAGRLKIPLWKPGYWRYTAKEAPEATLERATRALRSLADLGRENGVVAGLHNHAGDYVGCGVWELREILSTLDPKWAGYYYDPCHATTEGGQYVWELSLRLILPRLKMIAVKDFYWEKTGGEWKKFYAPMGQGMVNWKKFFAMIKQANFSGPISLHQEYKTNDGRADLAKDLEFVKKMLA